MGPSRTWHIPVRGRFWFRPYPQARPPRAREERPVPPPAPQRPRPRLPPVCDPCYHCARQDGGHEPGCPKEP